jgi:uncharacterized protein
MVVKTIVHFEIPANDVDRLSKFYSDVFGWKFEKQSMGGGMDYWMIETGPRRRSVGGGMYKKQMPMELPRNYIGVDKIEPAIATFLAAGGKEVVGKQEVPGFGWSYIGQDPEGNMIAMFEAAPRRQVRRAARKVKRDARKAARRKSK